MVDDVGNPRDAVFTTAAWDGRHSLADWNLHLARMKRHSSRLRIQLPDDFEQQVAQHVSRLTAEPEDAAVERNPNCLMRIQCTAGGKVTVSSRSIDIRDEDIDAITQPAPRWMKKINGTKHGAWKPYSDALATAQSKGADIALLVHEYALVDADRATPVVLDEDGTAWIASLDEGGTESITLSILSPELEKHGIPVHHGRLNERLVARAEEIVAVGSGIGVCQIISIDGVDTGHGSALTALCRTILAEHYADIETWTSLEA